ncbi:MAG: curlin repeat-containing protein [Verrucomicrobiota bacterium]
MKRLSLLLVLFLLNIFTCFSQSVIGSGAGEAIRQISTSGIADILSFQTLNQGISNYVLTQQVGEQNTTKINQQNDPVAANQSYTLQQGNLNELSVGQIGSGNILLGFQLGFLSIVNNNQGILPSVSLSGVADGGQKGDRNKLEVSQEGENNGIMAVQQGDNNTIDAGQKGSDNYLLILQKGTNNSVTGYMQENSSGRNFDTIIQEGESLSLEATGVSTSKAMGNIFSQSGSELALKVNSGFVNTLGGIEVTQTGSKMTVVIDQSFFP